MRKFSVGLDLGSQQVAVAVYDYSKQASIPLEVGGGKTMPNCVAFEKLSSEDVIVGKRAESRSAKKCEGVLCAYRDLVYGMRDDRLKSKSQQRWHFNVDEQHGANNEAVEDCGYTFQGEKVSVKLVISKVVGIVCQTVVEAARPGSALQVDDAEQTTFLSFAISVPECFDSVQRQLISNAAALIVKESLGAATEILILNETAAVALQFCSVPPFSAKKFLIVDMGASKLTVSAFELKTVGVDVYQLEELVSRTDILVSGGEIEYKMMQWCEKRRPFQDSMLECKPALFKLRKEIRAAMKTLTVAEEAMIECDGVVAGKDLQLMLTLEDFEHECAEIFDQVTEVVNAVSSEVGSCPPEVVFVGGAMRIPRLQKNVQALVGTQGAVIKKTVDMDRAVCLGLATLSALHFDVSSVRLPLDPQTPYKEQDHRLPLVRGKDGIALEQSGLHTEGSGSKGADEAQIAELKAQIEGLKKRNDNFKDSEEKMKEQLYQQQQLIDQLRKEAQPLSPAAPDSSLIEERDNWKSKAMDMEAEVKGLKAEVKKLQDLEAEVNKLKGLEKELLGLKGVQAENDRLRGVVAEHQALKELANEAQKLKAEAIAKAHAFKSANEKAQKELEAARTRSLAYEQEVVALENKLEVAEQKTKTSELELLSCQEALSESTQETGSYWEQLQRKEQNEVALQAEISRLTEERDSLLRSKPSSVGWADDEPALEGEEQPEPGEEKSDEAKEQTGRASQVAQANAHRRLRLSLWRFSIEFKY